MAHKNSAEIKEEIAHREAVLHSLKERLRVLEQKAARLGPNLPVEDTVEIRDLVNRILEHELEITKLRTLAVEDQVPVAEAEYRALLAEVWQEGKPTVIGTSKLELARLRLGITREAATTMEHKVRQALAVENFYNIPKYVILRSEPEDGMGTDIFSVLDLPLYKLIALEKETPEKFIYLGRSILQDPITALKLISQYLIPQVKTLEMVLEMEEIDVMCYSLLFGLTFVHNIWPDQDVYAVFQRFVDDFKDVIINNVLVGTRSVASPSDSETGPPPPYS